MFKCIIIILAFSLFCFSFLVFLLPLSSHFRPLRPCNLLLCNVASPCQLSRSASLSECLTSSSFLALESPSLLLSCIVFSLPDVFSPLLSFLRSLLLYSLRLLILLFRCLFFSGLSSSLFSHSSFFALISCLFLISSCQF